MHVAHRRCRVEFDHMVAVGNAVDRILGRTFEPEPFSRVFAVDGEVRAGERRGAQGAASHAAVEVAEAREVALHHPEEGHHPVREEDRLAGLHVRVARHDHRHVGPRNRDEFRLKRPDSLLNLADRMTQIHLRGGRRLIVAASAGMETPARGTHDFGHALFDRHMDVLVLHGEDEFARADFRGDLVEAGADRFSILLADDALAGEHRCMRLRILNVERADALLERNRGVEFLNELIGGKVETAAAALAFLVAHLNLLSKQQNNLDERHYLSYCRQYER